MNTDCIELGTTVQHIEGGRTCEVVGHAKGAAGWLHLVRFVVGKRTVEMWLGRGVLVEA